MEQELLTQQRIGFRAVPGAVFQVYLGRGTAQAVPAFRRCTLSPLLGPRRVSLIYIKPPSVRDAPDEAYRKAGADVQRETVGQTVGVAMVVPLTGFMGATARAVVNGISALSGVTVNQRVFERLDDACHWLAGLPSQPAHHAQDLIRHVEELEALLTAPG